MIASYKGGAISPRMGPSRASTPFDDRMSFSIDIEEIKEMDNFMRSTIMHEDDDLKDELCSCISQFAPDGDDLITMNRTISTRNVN